jgi:hypothetical protein
LSGSNLTVTHSTSITPGEENGVTVTFQKNYYQMATSGAIDLYYIKDVGNFTAGASRADGKTNAQTDTITLTFGDLPSSLSYFNATDFTVTGASLDSIGPLSIYGGSIINGSLQGGTIELSVSSVTGAVGVTFAKQYYANKTASAAGVSTGAITVMNVTADENGSSTATGNLTITLDTAIDWYGLSITTGVSGLTVPNTGSVTNSNSQTLTVTNSMSSPSTDNITSGNFSMSGTGYTFTNSGFLGVQVGNP